MNRPVISMVMVLGLATAALAHQGVKDPGVMARMEGMKTVGKAMDLLEDMAAGKRPLDLIQAQGAKAAIARHLGEAEALFKEPHSDPKSEALPKIWEDYAGFTASLDKAWDATTKLRVRNLDALRATLPITGQGCLDCHKVYRKEK